MFSKNNYWKEINTIASDHKPHFQHNRKHQFNLSFCTIKYKSENMQFLIREEGPSVPCISMHYTICSLLLKSSTASFTNQCTALLTTEKMSIGFQLQCLKQYVNGLYSLSSSYMMWNNEYIWFCWKKKFLKRMLKLLVDYVPLWLLISFHLTQSLKTMSGRKIIRNINSIMQQ